MAGRESARMRGSPSLCYLRLAWYARSWRAHTTQESYSLAVLLPGRASGTICAISHWIIAFSLLSIWKNRVVPIDEMAARILVGESLVVRRIFLDLGGMPVIELIHFGFVGVVQRPEGLGLRLGQIHVRPDDRFTIGTRGGNIQLPLCFPALRRTVLRRGGTNDAERAEGRECRTSGEIFDNAHQMFLPRSR